MEQDRRLLIYSHDSFGLGHLRRCRAIAHDLVERYRRLSVLILSGSPIIGSFDFKSRVDFVRIPGVIKLRNGEYTSLNLHIDLEKTLEMRSSIIQHTARIFDPHVFLVDKEPLGLRGEVEPTLRMLKESGARRILGLRDVMDDPISLVDEWTRKKAFNAFEEHYDEIWIYGLPQIFDPVWEIPGMARHEDKLHFTGYIRRSAPESSSSLWNYELPDHPFILVTTGGGGDGVELIDWVISAYEHDPTIPHHAILLFGPFMHLEERTRFQERAGRIDKLHPVTFEAQVEQLFERAIGVVAMGGYNTFCEILSFEKPSLIVPRTTPRREQALRASRAEALGLVRVLAGDAEREPASMAAQLHDIDAWPRPDGRRHGPMLGGLETIADRLAPWLDEERQAPLGSAAD